jgi:hypothetical protein
VRQINSPTAARQARRKPRTTRRKPHQHQLAPASLTTGAPEIGRADTWSGACPGSQVAHRGGSVDRGRTTTHRGFTV